MRENNVPLIQLQVKLKKITDITYLEGNEKKSRDWILDKRFWHLEVRKKVLFMFWKPNKHMKGKCCVVTGYKQRNKVQWCI